MLSDKQIFLFPVPRLISVYVCVHTCCVQDPVPARAVAFTPDRLHGNLLAVADEVGTVQLLDTRRPLINSLVTSMLGICNISCKIIFLWQGFIRIFFWGEGGTTHLFDHTFV